MTERPFRHLLASSLLFSMLGSLQVAAKPASDAPLHPVAATDFSRGVPALSIGPGEKRLGRTFGIGPAKHPYSAFKDKRQSIVEYLHCKKNGVTVLEPKEALSADVFGALTPYSGTFAGWFRPGKVMKEGGWLVSGWGMPVGIPYGRQLWGLGIRDEKKPDKAGKLYFTAPSEGLNAISSQSLNVDSDWLHLAVVWDADSGVRLYVNGELAGEEWSPGARQPAPALTVALPVQRLRIEADPEAAVYGLQLFEQPLNAEGVAALYRKALPDAAMVEPTKTSRTVRLARLGWDKKERQKDPIIVKAGKPLEILEAAVLDAREELRSAGWVAVDGFLGSGFPWQYHGYLQTGQPRELHLKLDPSVSVNYLIGHGRFTGKLTSKGEGAITIKNNEGSFTQPVTEGEIDGKVAIRQVQGLLETISFYEIKPHTGNTIAGDTQWLVPAKESIFTPIAKRHFHAGYGDTDRKWIAATTTKAVPSETQLLPALHPLHLTTSPVKNDFTLGSIALHLETHRQAKSMQAQVVVHDLLWPGRTFGRFDLLLKPATDNSPSRYDLHFDLRDTLLPKGTQLWLTITFEDDTELAFGKGGSQLTLLPAADPKRALALWRDWEWRTVRNHFESISEPRPWSTIDNSPESAWWLRVYMPTYDAMDTGLRRLLARFPDDPLFRSTFQFTHPQNPNPSHSIALPKDDVAPRWAVLTRECLLLYKEFVHWWIEHRQHINGEFGHSFGDDSDLLQDWPDLALITDPEGKVRRSLEVFADGIANTYRLKDGQLAVHNGLNGRWTDALHAYEEGLNVQPHDFLLHYGDPVRFQRLLDTVSRYDSYLLKPEKNEMRTFAGEEESGQLYWSSDKAPEGSYRQRYNYLLLHAGLLSGWYHNHPETWRMLKEVGRWTLTRHKEADTGWEHAAFALMVGLQQHTCSIQWLEPYLEHNLWENSRTLVLKGEPAGYPNLIDRLAGLDRKATFHANFEEPATRFANLGTTFMGGTDQRYLQGWIDWKLTGERTHLYASLEALYRRLKYTMPVITEAGQSGDRVAIPKTLISQLYLGGVPASRNRSFYPDFAVSYEGLNDTFAAMVLENQPAHLKVLLYNFESQPQKGKIITWALERGLYEVTGQPEEGTEERRVIHQEVRLERGEGFEITLPPKTSWVINVRQLKRETLEGLLADAAFAPGESRYANGILTVPLYNLGLKPLSDVPIRLLSEDGKVLAQKTIKALPPVTNWKLGRTEVHFTLNAKSGERFTLEADPKGKHDEITRRNNLIDIKIP